MFDYLLLLHLFFDQDNNTLNRITVETLPEKLAMVEKINIINNGCLYRSVFTIKVSEVMQSGVVSDFLFVFH